jgi:hypothetical protein
VSKQITHKFHIERFNQKKLNEVEGKEGYRVEISNMIAPLENLDDDLDTSRAWKTISNNIKILAKESLGYYELKEHKPWFDGICSKLLDQRKQAKLKWLQDPNQINGDTLNNVRREASRHFRKKKQKPNEEPWFQV